MRCSFAWRQQVVLVQVKIYSRQNINLLKCVAGRCSLIDNAREGIAFHTNIQYLSSAMPVEKQRMHLIKLLTRNLV